MFLKKTAEPIDKRRRIGYNNVSYETLLRGDMNDQNTNALNFLKSLKLFSGVDSEVLKSLLESGMILNRAYAAGETVYSPLSEEKKLIFFLSGESEVYSTDDSRTMLLKTLKKGGVVGVANLFSPEKYVSRVIATKRSETLELSAEAYGKLLEADKNAMYNYLSFLSNRICYLNKKIVCLTAGSSERRLAYYLDSALSEADERGESTNEVTVQMNTLCEMLNLGRASLYRAADKLCDDGFIAREGKTIKILDRYGMLNKYN